VSGLRAIERDEQAANVVRGVARPAGDTVFVFPGQGSQWAGMGSGLLDTSPVFAEHLRECAAALSEHVDWSPIDVLRGLPGAPPLGAGGGGPALAFAVMGGAAGAWGGAGRKSDGGHGSLQG